METINIALNIALVESSRLPYFKVIVTKINNGLKSYNHCTIREKRVETLEEIIEKEKKRNLSKFPLIKKLYKFLKINSNGKNLLLEEESRKYEKEQIFFKMISVTLERRLRTEYKDQKVEKKKRKNEEKMLLKYSSLSEGSVLQMLEDTEKVFKRYLVIKDFKNPLFSEWVLNEKDRRIF